MTYHHLPLGNDDNQNGVEILRFLNFMESFELFFFFFVDIQPVCAVHRIHNDFSFLFETPHTHTQANKHIDRN